MRSLCSLLFVLFASSALTVSANAEPPAATPVHLRCEYLNNPVGIDIVQPRLSWKLASEKRGQVQSAYRIMVASSADKLTADNADLWDSGIVKSNESPFVESGWH